MSWRGAPYSFVMLARDIPTHAFGLMPTLATEGVASHRRQWLLGLRVVRTVFVCQRHTQACCFLCGLTDGPPPLSAVVWPSSLVEMLSSLDVGRASLVSSLEFLMSVDLLALVGTRPESTRTPTARLGHTVHLFIEI